MPEELFNPYYKRYGFSANDGVGVCFNFYEIEQHYLDKYTWPKGSGPSRKKLKDFLFLRDGNKCKYCGKKLKFSEATVDHFYPMCMWEEWQVDECNKVNNLVLACQPCNFYKGNKSPVGWIVYDRENRSLWLKIWVLLRRYRSRAKLILKGTRTISGEHKGFHQYKKRQEAKNAIQKT